MLCHVLIDLNPCYFLVRWPRLTSLIDSMPDTQQKSFACDTKMDDVLERLLNLSKLSGKCISVSGELSSAAIQIKAWSLKEKVSVPLGTLLKIHLIFSKTTEPCIIKYKLYISACQVSLCQNNIRQHIQIRTDKWINKINDCSRWYVMIVVSENQRIYREIVATFVQQCHCDVPSLKQLVFLHSGQKNG